MTEGKCNVALEAKVRLEAEAKPVDKDAVDKDAVGRNAVGVADPVRMVSKMGLADKPVAAQAVPADLHRDPVKCCRSLSPSLST